MLGRCIELSDYGSYGSWKVVIGEVGKTYGNYDKTSVQKWLQGQYDRWSSQLARTMVIVNKLPEIAGRAGFQQRGQELRGDINLTKTEIAGITAQNERGVQIVADSALTTFDEVAVFGRNVATVNPGISVIEADAGSLAQEAENSVTGAELEQLRQNAGGDDLYFSQLYNNLFQKKLVEQYESILPKEAVADIKAQVKASDEYLQENKPSAFLENETVGKVLDYYEKEGNPFSNPWKALPTGLKWAIGIGAGLFALGAVGKIAGFGTAVMKRKPKDK